MSFKKIIQLLSVPPPPPSDSTTPVAVEEVSPTEQITNDLSPPILPPPGSDRKTRGFSCSYRPRTHNITRTNRKQKNKLQ